MLKHTSSWTFLPESRQIFTCNGGCLTVKTTSAMIPRYYFIKSHLLFLLLWFREPKWQKLHSVLNVSFCLVCRKTSVQNKSFCDYEVNKRMLDFFPNIWSSKCYSGIFISFIKSFIKGNTALRWEHLLRLLAVAAPGVVGNFNRLCSNAQKGQISVQYYFPTKLCILSDLEYQMCGALCIRSLQKALLSSVEFVFCLQYWLTSSRSTCWWAVRWIST